MKRFRLIPPHIHFVVSFTAFVLAAAAAQVSASAAPFPLTPRSMSRVNFVRLPPPTNPNADTSYSIELTLETAAGFAPPLANITAATNYFAAVAPASVSPYLWRVRGQSIDRAGAWPRSLTFDMPDGTPRLTRGWAITVYYTAVESYHSGFAKAVYGCRVLQCSKGSSYLGSYPTDFVQAVKDEGTGRITSGPHAGKYLNWSINVGYWLDTAPRDARGRALIPYVSAAADVSVKFETRLKVLECGVDDTTGRASDVSSAVCAQLKSANWSVRDRFTQSNVGKHADLYIGEEDAPDFYNTSHKVISTKKAAILMSR